MGAFAISVILKKLKKMRKWAESSFQIVFIGNFRETYEMDYHLWMLFDGKRKRMESKFILRSERKVLLIQCRFLWRSIVNSELCIVWFVGCPTFSIWPLSHLKTKRKLFFKNKNALANNQTIKQMNVQHFLFGRLFTL